MSVIDQIRSFKVYPYALHITRIENLAGIFDSGKIFSRHQMDGKIFTDISEQSVQGIRSQKIIQHSGLSIHNYVPFFLSFKAPMVAARQSQNEDLVYIQIGLDIFTRIEGCILTDGNATNATTRFEVFDSVNTLGILDLSVLYKVSYANDAEKSRKKAAEILVPKSVPTNEIKSLIFYGESGRDKGLNLIANSGINPAVKVLRRYFFESRPQGDI